MSGRDLISPEKLGELLAAVSQNQQQTADLRGAVDTIDEKVDALIESDAQGRTLVLVGRGLVGILIAGLLTGAGWFYEGFIDHDRRITTHESQIMAIEQRVEYHDRAPGHASTIEAYGGMREDIAAMRATLAAMQRSLDSMADQMQRKRGRR